MKYSGGLAVKSGRIHSLDGLRGLAATVVLLHHSLLVFPSLATSYFDGSTIRWSGAWWLVNTPLHLLWEGTAAVYIFFILSGLVLAKPVSAAARSFSWKAFYPQRLIRLYVPVWAAVLFTAVTFWIVPRTSQMASEWIQYGQTQVTLHRFLLDMTLVLGNGGLASPLWSLRWEILFSLLLPLFVWAADKVRRTPVLAILGCLVVVGLGEVLNQSALRYMPMFAIGVLILPVVDSMRGAAKEALGRGGRSPWPALLAAGLLLMNLRWLLPSFHANPIGDGVLLALAAGGACVIVIGAATYPPVGRLLASRPLLWLGKISFSLYLVHEPVVIATAYLLGPGSENIAVPVAIIISLLVGTLFFRVVEQPSYRLAKTASQLFTPGAVKVRR